MQSVVLPETSPVEYVTAVVEQSLMHKKEDEFQLKVVRQAQVSTVPETRPFVLVRLEHWMMHLAEVELKANLVWHPHVVRLPETRPVE